MTRRATRQLLIDQVATILRKPSAAPTVTPSEAIAIALTSARWKPDRFIDPGDRVVALVLRALKDAGWKIEPR